MLLRCLNRSVQFNMIFNIVVNTLIYKMRTRSKFVCACIVSIGFRRDARTHADWKRHLCSTFLKARFSFCVVFISESCPARCWGTDCSGTIGRAPSTWISQSVAYILLGRCSCWFRIVWVWVAVSESSVGLKTCIHGLHFSLFHVSGTTWSMRF